MLHGITLFGQLLLGGLHARAGELVDLQALNNLPVTVLADAREGVDQAFLDAAINSLVLATSASVLATLMATMA